MASLSYAKLAAFVIILAATLALVAASPQFNRISTDRHNDYSFNYDVGSHFRDEAKSAETGLVKGKYGFLAADGCLRIFEYESGGNDSQGHKITAQKKDCDPQHIAKYVPNAPKALLIRNTPFARPTRPMPLPTTPLPIVPVNNFIEETTTTKSPRRGRKLEPTPEKKSLYGFSFAAPGHGHSEMGFKDGSKMGEYYWDAPDGYRYITTYKADDKGYRPKLRKVKISDLPPEEAPNRNPPPPPPPPTQNPRGRALNINKPVSPQPVNQPKTQPPEEEEEEEVCSCAAKDKKKEGREARQLPPPEPEGPLVDSEDCRPYRFGYDLKTHYHREEGFANCTKIGEYGAVFEDGFMRITSYVADETGYHPMRRKVPVDNPSSGANAQPVVVPSNSINNDPLEARDVSPTTVPPFEFPFK